ncbi:zinc knuckle (CCHC-type) family protein [Actinidia rufa]|uniref:Zinc knuckle (CCHC-type) family protein n=1 Tax=Actinidia rufa TaxID=165716 RepID=A0A7J0FUD7_9ERIC|nr:zinc knuckle (CCHC-type) family protein [Actinidia rufa]
MGKREKNLKASKSHDEEEDEENEDLPTKSVVLVSSSSDDEEANEDLSLKIVQKAMLRACSAPQRSNESNSVGDAVINLSSSPDVKIEKKIRKEKKQKKKNKKETAVVGKEEGKAETSNVTEINENAHSNPVEISDNVVLRKLLRGPRYFDPPNSGWGTCYNCGEEGHTAVNCASAKRKKPCFVCGSLEHNAKQCKKPTDDPMILHFDPPTSSTLAPTPLPISHAPKEHIDAILDEQIVSTRDGGVQRFFIRWRGGPNSDDTWISNDDLQRIDRDLFKYYHSRLASHSTESSFLHPGGIGGDTGPRPRPTIRRVYEHRPKRAYQCQIEKWLLEREGFPISNRGQDCYICKKGGHRAKDCPEKYKGGSHKSKICLKCGDPGHDMFSCKNGYAPDDLKVRKKLQMSTPTQKFSENKRDHVRTRSVPFDLGSTRKRKKAQYEEEFTTPPNSKWRGGWITEDPGDLSRGKAKVRGWGSPVTPTNNRNKAYIPLTSGHASSSRSSRKDSNGSSKFYQHRYSASRFGNFSSDGMRRNYYW